MAVLAHPEWKAVLVDDIAEFDFQRVIPEVPLRSLQKTLDKAFREMFPGGVTKNCYSLASRTWWISIHSQPSMNILKSVTWT